jgi:dihydroorotate dehydrogenase (fumarate)
MGKLNTSYMGIALEHPIIAGASSLTSNMDTVKQLEESGAAAIVISSLFEEQIQLERMRLEEELSRFDNLDPEMITVFPHVHHAGPEEHLMWVRKAKESVGIPVIASLNAVNHETWVEYAGLLAETGVDGLELNFYATPVDAAQDGGSIEDEQIAVLRDINASVSIPISVKLSPFYTNPLHVIGRMDAEGVAGFVLFNRFFQPEIDVAEQKNTYPLNLSREGDYGLSLRFTALLFGTIAGDLCANTGIFSGEDVARMILAGATCVEAVSTLFRNRIPHLKTMVGGLEAWMDDKGYASLDAFRGSLSQKNSSDPWAYSRAQYVRLLLRPNPLGETSRSGRP